MTDSVAQQVHETNKATLDSVAQQISPQSAAMNPLLARTKLKKGANKSKSKSKSNSKSGSKDSSAQDMVDAVQQAKQDELAVVSSDLAAQDEADVLDLADQLLEQLDARDNQEPTSVKPIAIAGVNVDSNQKEHTGLKPPAGKQLKKSSSTSSVGSGSSARERLHDMKEGLKHAFSPHSSPPTTPVSDQDNKMSRQKARKLKKEQQTEAIRAQAEAETAAENDRSVQDERDAIEQGCKKLGVRVREIDPDGHCLFSAIADQVNSLKLSTQKEDYMSMRAAAAQYMREHPDDFLPFFVSEVNDDAMMSPEEYEKYCVTVEKTSEWGGEPEIRALAKYFHAPIHVLQAGTDLIKTGGEEDEASGRGPMLISYHRKMYGLGEHYNSLRPAHYGGINQPDFRVEAYDGLV